MKIASKTTIAYLKTLSISPLFCIPVLLITFSMSSGEYYNGIGVEILLSIALTFMFAYPYMLLISMPIIYILNKVEQFTFLNYSLVNLVFISCLFFIYNDNSEVWGIGSILITSTALSSWFVHSWLINKVNSNQVD